MLYNYYCGNPIKYKGDTMVWLRGRMLYAYTKGETTCSFNYDVNGICRRKSTTAGKTEYLISDGKLIGQNYYASGASEPSKKITFVYTHNGLTGCVIDKMTYVYHKDVFGNVVALISGVMPVAYYQYDAWGNCKVLNPNGTENTDPNFAGNVNPIRYRSYYYDADIGLYYLQTRYYDPETGRFINLDQIEYIAPERLNGLNLYAYCNNNPVMGYDPMGTSLILIFLILAASTIAGGVIGGVVSDDQGKEGWELFGDVILGAAIGLAIGGAAILLTGVVAGAIGGASATVFGGVAAKTAFAVGALAFDFTAFIIAPIYGFSMKAIEYKTPEPVPIPNKPQPTPPHPYK